MDVVVKSLWFGINNGSNSKSYDSLFFGLDSKGYRLIKHQTCLTGSELRRISQPTSLCLKAHPRINVNVVDTGVEVFLRD